MCFYLIALKQLAGRLKVPFLFTAGNHDWHLERLYDWETSFDSQRKVNVDTVLRKLYSSSGKGPRLDPRGARGYIGAV